MKGLWFDAYERLYDELEREPTDAEIAAGYQQEVDRLCDAADDARKRERGE